MWCVSAKVELMQFPGALSLSLIVMALRETRNSGYECCKSMFIRSAISGNGRQCEPQYTRPSHQLQLDLCKHAKIHPETKVLIIKRLKTKSTADVADTFNVSQRQVQRIKKRFEETGDVFDKPRSGRPRKTTAREDRLLARKSKASPFSTAAELHETWSPEVPASTRTVCRILAFAKAHSLLKGWTLEKWQKVDFSEESSVKLHHSHCKYCRRPTGARMDPRFTQKIVKFGGGKIMVWGYIQYGGVQEICRVEGNISSLKYQEILATSYIPNHKRGQILQQDGAPSHTSISTSEFLKAKKIKMLKDWPAQSPDMNIIEHIGSEDEDELNGDLACKADDKEILKSFLVVIEVRRCKCSSGVCCGRMSSTCSPRAFISFVASSAELYSTVSPS
ncbi:hypothetical protein QQF64_023866 [Cirrhinus molitorella]|uniref:Tc1-like transposase DDE domain-containing protein n=1 Tax=Cirrhinus molitorella TaxID=172907 RepID=A0ABR3NKH6_9TELE